MDRRFQRRIAQRFFVRFHMSLILTAVIASGVLSSKGLLELGVHSLRLRYPLAVLASYVVFLLLVRIWIWYIRVCCTGVRVSGGGNSGSGGNISIDLDGEGIDSGTGGFRGFGGGDSGGGGATGSWDSDVASEPTSSSWLPDLDIGGGDDNGWLVLLLLAALVLAIVGAGGYLVWAAPHILPEAASQAILAPVLAHAARKQQHTWIDGVFRSTWIPLLIILILATALGWAAHHHCPAATRLIDAVRCPAPYPNP
jgi:hypothetical protein